MARKAAAAAIGGAVAHVTRAARGKCERSGQAVAPHICQDLKPVSCFNSIFFFFEVLNHITASDESPSPTDEQAYKEHLGNFLNHNFVWFYFLGLGRRVCQDSTVSRAG